MCDSFLRPPSSKPVRQPSQQIRISPPIAFQNGQKKSRNRNVNDADAECKNKSSNASAECEKQENAMSSWHDMMHILGVVGC
jgi:hypothetical protein